MVVADRALNAVGTKSCGSVARSKIYDESIGISYGMVKIYERWCLIVIHGVAPNCYAALCSRLA